MFNLFKKEEKSLYSPDKGGIIPITEVDDPVFSAKMMGDGFAVIPETGDILSPCDGEVLQVFKTKHAIVIRSNDGLELIVHIGLETVSLKGEGFDVAVTDGQKVKAGDLLVKADLDFILQEGKKIVTPVVITNMDIIEKVSVVKGSAKANDIALNYVTK